MVKKTILTFFTIGVLTISLYGETAFEIMKKSDSLPEPRNARSIADMNVTKRGEVDKKVISIMALKTGNNEKVIATIKEKSSGDVTKILTHTKRDGDDLQWLKMPNGNKKRITIADRSGVFVNSHIFYEDLRSRNINDYNYRLLGEKNVESYDCYIIEAIPKLGKSVYNKVVFFVIKSGKYQYFIIRADIFFDGYLYKRLVNYDLKMIDGIITPYRSVMYRIHRNGDILGNTEIIIKGIEYNNTKIKNSMFHPGRL